MTVRITLHSGLHKCASTYIQYRWWAAFGQALAVWYPPPAIQEPGHVEFAQALGDSAFAACDMLSSWVEQAPHVQRLLVSAEDCTRVDTTRAAPSLADVVARAGFELDSHLVVLRKPSQRFSSMWAQLVMAGHSGSQSHLLDEVVKESCLEPGKLDAYLRHVGCGRTVVFLLGGNRSGGVGSDVLQALGLKELAESVAVVPEPDVLAENRARSRLDLELVARLNAVTGWRGTSSREVRALLKALDQCPEWLELARAHPNWVDDDARNEVRRLAEIERDWLLNRASLGELTIAGQLELLEDWAE